MKEHLQQWHSLDRSLPQTLVKKWITNVLGGYLVAFHFCWRIYVEWLFSASLSFHWNTTHYKSIIFSKLLHRSLLFNFFPHSSLRFHYWYFHTVCHVIDLWPLQLGPIFSLFTRRPATVFQTTAHVILISFCVSQLFDALFLISKIAHTLRVKATIKWNVISQ